METKFLSCNVNGLNSPQQRKCLFYWLNKHNFSLICLQEVHIKRSDNKYIKNNKLGCEFLSLAKVKKRGVIIYAKKELQPKKIFEDSDGRFLAVEIHLEGKKTLVVGVYAQNGSKENFFRNLKYKLDEENYEQIILMGDLNGVCDTQIDKSPPHKGGKLPKTFIEIIEQEQLVDVWRNWNTKNQKFTYYSPSKKSSSRIDMIWVSKKLEVQTARTENLPRIISDYNPTLWTIKVKNKKNRYLEIK